MQTEEFNRRYADEYLALLKNRDVPHNRLLLTFSGVPGSGKTTLARKLSHDLRAQYIEHDTIRGMLRSHNIDVASINIAAISRRMVASILNDDANKFIILDSSIDRTWDMFYQTAEKYRAKTILIRLTIPEITVKQRLSERHEGDFGSLRNLETFMAQFKNCKAHIKADLELSDDYDYEVVLKKVEHLIY